jgi:nucleoside-diphosphate-sugar epimerase
MIVITGCNGLVGSFIARKFLREGFKIRALKRTGSDLSLIADIASDIEWIEGDILDVVQLTKAMQGAEYVIHAAAIVSFAPADHENMLKVNVEGTYNVVNTCLATGIKKMCFVSSVAAIGRKKNAWEVSEESQWEESSYNSYYAKSKYLAELEVWRGIAEGLPAVIVNPSVVLGPGNWHKSSAKLFKYVWDEKPFYTAGSMNYVDVRDVADIIFRLINSEITSERFILNAGSIKIKDLFGKIAAAFGKKKPAIQVSPFMAQIAWRLEFLRSLLSGSSPLVTRETALLAQKDYFYTNYKVQQTLQYTFKNLEDTISWTCMKLSK